MRSDDGTMRSMVEGPVRRTHPFLPLKGEGDRRRRWRGQGRTHPLSSRMPRSGDRPLSSRTPQRGDPGRPPPPNLTAPEAAPAAIRGKGQATERAAARLPAQPRGLSGRMMRVEGPVPSRLSASRRPG